MTVDAMLLAGQLRRSELSSNGARGVALLIELKNEFESRSSEYPIPR